MILNIVLLLVGLVLVVLGADWLVDGSSAIARKAGISEFVIGLTIVGFGTSCPELVVSLTGALQGNADISIGNVIGSNIFNTLLILGITAVLSPILITRSNRLVDIPIVMLVSVIFVVAAITGTSIGRLEGIIFLVIFAAYIFYCFKSDYAGLVESEDSAKIANIWMSIFLTFAGLVGLVFGGRFFVDNSVLLAHQLGVSDKVIAITLLAGGTSLPELVTCIVASVKHKDQLALGNILGSNVFNILLILGLSAVVTPLNTAAVNIFDFAGLLSGVVLIWLWSFTGRKGVMYRWEGFALLALYVAYMSVLFVKM